MKITLNMFFPYIFPLKGTLTDAGDGDGGGKNKSPKSPQITKDNKQIQKSLNNMFFSILFPPVGNFG